MSRHRIVSGCFVAALVNVCLLLVVHVFPLPDPYGERVLPILLAGLVISSGCFLFALIRTSLANLGDPR